MAATKRLNFDVSPEQEAEIAWLRGALGSSSTKDAVVRAVQIILEISRASEHGGELVIRHTDGRTERIVIPGLQPREPRWQFLTRRPHPWRSQPWVKGTRLLASTVWRDMLTNQLTVEQAAENWDLPLSAINEAVAWSESNQDLIELESAEELRRLSAGGIELGTQVAG